MARDPSKKPFDERVRRALSTTTADALENILAREKLVNAGDNTFTFLQGAIEAGFLTEKTAFYLITAHAKLLSEIFTAGMNGIELNLIVNIITLLLASFGELHKRFDEPIGIHPPQFKESFVRRNILMPTMPIDRFILGTAYLAARGSRLYKLQD